MSKGYRRGGPQWLVRAGYCMERLEKKLKREVTLPDIAEAVVAANELFSALSEGYDEYYTLSAQKGLIDRRPQNPLSAEPADMNERLAELSEELEPLAPNTGFMVENKEPDPVTAEEGEKNGVEPSPPDSAR